MAGRVCVFWDTLLLVSMSSGRARLDVRAIHSGIKTTARTVCLGGRFHCVLIESEAEVFDRSIEITSELGHRFAQLFRLHTGDVAVDQSLIVADQALDIL